MPTLNGIGTKFHGFRSDRGDGTICVTNWLVFLYFPILPLSSSRIRFSTNESGQLVYHVVEKIPMNVLEIATTYFWGWVITPILWFWPIPFAVREVGEYLGYTNENAEGGFYMFVIIFAIAWIAVFAWKWKDWDDKRWFRDYAK